MIVLAFLYISIIEWIVGIPLGGLIDTGIAGIKLPGLAIYVFEWALFFFIRYLKSIENRRG